MQTTRSIKAVAARSDASTPEGRRAIFERLFNDAELVVAVGEA